MKKRVAIPVELKEFFLNDYKETTPYNEPLHQLFKHLLEEYFGDTHLKTTRDLYMVLADNISQHALDTHLVDFDDFIQASTLVNIYVGDKARKSKLILVAVYDYLNFSLTKNNKRNGEYWIREIRRMENKGDYSKDILPKKAIGGTTVIDDAFIDENYKSTSTLEENFYLAKNDYQWAGVINGLDELREDYEKLKSGVILSFDESLESRIPYVVCGPGGSGKSTLLRRLAKDLINNGFYTLWVTNFSVLLNQLEQLIADSNKYLIIIEDWENLTLDSHRAPFLYRISFAKNIRVIIGDRSINQREYLDYFNIKNTFYITSNDNKKILKKVVEKLPDWKETADKVLSQDEIYASSLYLLLFVIAKTRSEGSADALQKITDVESKFKSIVRKDLRTLQKAFPAFPRAMYYCMNLFNEIGTTAVSWEAFLTIIDYYNGNEDVSRELAEFNKAKPLCKILSYYFDIIELKVFGKHGNVFYCHHLLLQEAFLEPLDDTWGPFENTNRIELLDILIEKGNLYSARGVYEAYMQWGDVFKDKAQVVHYFKLLEKTPTTFEILFLQEMSVSYDILMQYLSNVKEELTKQNPNEKGTDPT